MKSSSFVSKLTAIAGPPFASGPPQVTPEVRRRSGSMLDQLLSLLGEKNGYYAFESALEVFPAITNGAFSLEWWNSESTWRNSYKGLAVDGLFFAQDALAGQYCIADNQVYRFDPETGDRKGLADSLEEWAELIVDDFEYHTGYPLAHKWQKTHRPLKRGERLFPKRPFVLGGDFAVGNLRVDEAVSGLRFFGDIAVQIHNLPEGAKVEFRVVD